jgi:hypothetical protein
MVTTVFKEVDCDCESCGLYSAMTRALAGADGDEAELVAAEREDFRRGVYISSSDVRDLGKC